MDISNGILKKIYPSDLESYYISDGNIFHTLKIPEGVTEIEAYACENLPISDVILPESLEIIGVGAFKNCSLLTNIKIPDRVDFIGSFAFNGCSKLKYVKVSDNVETIYESTFENCSSLEEVELPYNLQRIAREAFSDCTSLETINIPECVRTIEDSAFHNCKLLKTIFLPNSLTTLGNSAFDNCRKLQSLTLPDNIEEIPTSLCNECVSLKDLKLPNNATYIGQRAFYNCKSLESVNIPDNVEEIKHFAFYNCKNLEIVNLPNNPNLNIGGSVFSYCDNLKTINLPEGLPFINVAMFENCKELSVIDIPSTVTSIIGDAFKNSGIMYFNLPEGLTSINSSAFEYCNNLEEITIPDSVEFICKNAFNGCTNLRKVKLPANLSKIENNAFSGCSNLTSIKIPDGTRTIGYSAFANCRKLKYVEMPDSIEAFGDACFSCNDKIEEINLSKNIKEIPYQAFINCYNLKSIEIPEGVKSIDSYAFYYCGNLKNIKLPETLENINEHVFQHTALQSIVIPDSVKTIGQSAFNNCRKLSSVKLSNKISEIETGTFSNCPSLRHIEIPESVKVIGSDAFYMCKGLEQVSLPDNLEVINASAFQNCSSLKTLSIPKNIKTIGVDAFSGCTSLESVFIPDTVENFEMSLDNNLKYFKKEKDGFRLLAKPEKDAISIENINPSFLSKNWEHKDILLKEQKNPLICDFYNSFLKNLPQKDVDKFLNSHNFTFFKQFNLDPSNPKQENISLYKFLYNMGGFEKPFVDEKGKIVDYAQKVCGFMLLKLQQNHISITDIFYATEFMENQGFKREFSDFFMKNFDEIIFEDLANKGFFARCYNEFEKVQKTNTNNRGSQRQLKPTVQKFREYFEENKFIGITDENKHISDTISPYFSEQSTFDYAIKIDNERRAKRTPRSILGFHLTENPFTKIDEYGKEIQYIQSDTTKNLVDTATKQFTFDWLEKNDPRNYILGKLCSCCAHLEGVGEGIMHASITHPNVQNLVVKFGGEIIAKSTLYINPEEGYGVFNNVEVHDEIPQEALGAIYEKYILGVRRFAEEYNKLHPNKPLKKISVGMNLNDLTDEIEKNHLPTDPLLTAIDYGKFTQCGEGYSGDSDEQQYTLWEKE